MDYFKTLIASKSSNGESKIGWGSTPGSTTEASLGATTIGNARKGKREAKIQESDIIDKTLPSITGTVISIVRGNGAWSSFKVGVAVKSVDVPVGSVSTFVVPSGAIYQIASKKLDKSRACGEKIALPHVFPPSCVAVRIDGVVVVDVKGAKNGPNEAELKESDIPTGTVLTLKDVVLGYHKTAATPLWPERHGAYGACKSIDYGSNFVKGPSHPREKTTKIFDALAYASPGVHEQVIDVVCDHVGLRPAKLLEAADIDKEALADMMQKTIEANVDSKVGIGNAWEEVLFSEHAKAAWMETIEALKSKEVVSLNILRSFPVSALLRSHAYPIIQFPIDPSTASMTDRALSGVSFNVGIATSPDVCDLDDPLNPFVENGVFKFQEATLSIAADKALRAEPTEADPDPIGIKLDDIASKSLGSVAIDVSSFAYAIRGKNSEFVPSLLKTEDGTSVVIKQFLDSCKKCNLINAFGVYDYFRVWMLINELSPYLPSVHFTSDWNNEKAVESVTVQPKCENGWAGDVLPNIYDVATAVASTGVQVTKEFLEEFAVDDERYLTTPSRPMQYVAEDVQKKPVPPRPAKLDLNGYVCLNGLSETSINRVKKIPEGSNGYMLFVVYEDCAKDVLDSVTINQNALAGSEFLKVKFGDHLNAKLANTSCIYCIANPPISLKRGLAD